MVQGAEGGERHLATLTAGQHFGERAVLTNVRRTATVRARSQVEVVALGREEALTLSHTVAPFAQAIGQLPGAERTPVTTQ